MNVLGKPLKAMDPADVDKVVKQAKVASDAWKKSSFEGCLVKEEVGVGDWKGKVEEGRCTE